MRIPAVFHRNGRAPGRSPLLESCGWVALTPWLGPALVCRPMKLVHAAVFCWVLGSTGCSHRSPPEPMGPPAPTADLPPAPIHTEAVLSDDPRPATKAPEPSGITPLARFTQGVQTPESALYDAEGDRYLISNINGKPTDRDNNGFLMEISPEGSIFREKWIAAGENQVQLDAPKGLGISQGILYVADITRVRRFDLKTGAPRGEIAFPGASFLNDIAIGPDGRVYVSDSGVKGDDFAPTGTDAVYVIEKDKPRAIAKSPELGGPNGLIVLGEGILVNTMRSNQIYQLDKKGTRQQVTQLPTGGLDGLAAIGDTLLVTSWEGSALYRGKLGGTFEVALANLKGPADIGIDPRRRRLIVPRFLENAVEVYPLP